MLIGGFKLTCSSTRLSLFVKQSFHCDHLVPPRHSKLSSHISVVFPFPSLGLFLKLCNQMIRFVRQIFNGRRQYLHWGDRRIVGLDFKIQVVHQRVGMVVSRKSHGRVSQQLHAKQISNGVVFLVESKGSGIRDLSLL